MVVLSLNLSPPARAQEPARWPGMVGQPGGGGRTVLAWDAGGALARRPRPNVAACGLGIEGPVPLPGEYPPGSAGFRYWAAAEALSRAAAPWRGVLGGGRLPVRLGGAGAWGIYDRTSIRLGGAATPDTACRVLGCAVLDMLRPDLWDIAAAEADTLHAAFAEATVLLAAGARSGPAPAGAARPGLAAALADMVAATGPGNAAFLLLIAAQRAPAAPNLLAQFAAELAMAARVLDGPKLSARLRGLFAEHGLLARSPGLDRYDPHEAEDGTEIPRDRRPLPWVAVAASGLALPLLLCPASEQPRMFAAAPGADGAAQEPPAPLTEARRHAAFLVREGLAERPRIGRAQRSAPGTNKLATHLLVDDGRTLRLVRQRMVVAGGGR